MRDFLITTGFTLGFLLAVIGGYSAFLYVTYINDTVEEGSGYGFTIGQTKEEAYLAARKYYGDVFILHPIDKGGYGPHVEFSFSDEEYGLIKDRNRWDFYFSEDSFFNAVKLKFRENRLFYIHRHRKYFEVP